MSLASRIDALASRISTEVKALRAEKANATHVHAALDVTSGTLADARLPTRLLTQLEATAPTTSAGVDALLTSGWYHWSPTVGLPDPPAGGVALFVIAYSDVYVAQEAYDYRTTKTWRRSKIGTTAWTAWIRVVTSDDSRLSDTRSPSGTAGGDLGGTFPNPTVGAMTVPDVRSTNTVPNDYNGAKVKWAFKTTAAIGLPGGAANTYAFLHGFRGYSDSTGGPAFEYAYWNGHVYKRWGSTTSWSTWVKIQDAAQPTVFDNDARLSDARTPTSHTHDDRYYTETESDGRFVSAFEVGSGAVRRARGLVKWEQSISNGAGDLVIQTNMTFSNFMSHIHVQGYDYVGSDAIIDLKVGFYCYGGPSFGSYSAVSAGSFPVSNVRLMRRTSDSKVAIVISSGAAGGYWNYPKIVVDGVFGHGAITEAHTQGWTTSLMTDLSSLTPMVTVPVQQTVFDDNPSITGSDTGWLVLPLDNQWTRHSTTYSPPGYRKLRGVVYLRGVVKGGTVSYQKIANLPVGFRPTCTLLIPTIATGATIADINIGGILNASGTANIKAGDIWNSVGGNEYVSLDGLSFVADG